MNDFDGLLPSEFGFKSQGRKSPMATSKGSSRSTPNDVVNSIPNHTKNLTSDDPFADLFASSAAKSDPPFRASTDFASKPVYDKPVYDDDIFDAIPGLKSTSKVTYDNVFADAKGGGSGGDDGAFDDLLGGFGKSKSSSFGGKRLEKDEKGLGDFDDLIPGFGSSKSTSDRPTPDIGLSSEPANTASKATSGMAEDPFKVFESTSAPMDSPSSQFKDPLEEIIKLSSSRSTKQHSSSYSNGGVYDDSDPFDGLGKSVPAFSSDRTSGKGSTSPTPRSNTSSSWNTDKESFEKSSVRNPERHLQNKIPVEHDQEFQQAPFDMPTYSSGSNKPVGQRSTSPSYDNDGFSQANIEVDMSPKYEENSETNDDIWLTVSEIPLFTQPTAAPPPSRPPPPQPVHIPKSGTGSPASANAGNKSYFPSSTRFSQVPKSAPAATKLYPASQFDELEDFAMGRSSGYHNEHENDLPGEELEMNSAAAAMKEAMDKAQAKFRHAKEVRERENTKAARSKESVQFEKDDISVLEEKEKQERLDHKRQQKEREEKEQLRLEREREEKEKEQQRLEREREEKERERQRLERERERARQAVERATREARERAAAEARQRAERAAVEKANAEARVRSERAAVQRAQAEARERAAADAKERAEKAAAEAKEREARERTARAEAEARVKAERAAVERAAVEARERAAAEARERAAADARSNQQKNENDLESFFSMGARANSAPRPPRTSSSESGFDAQFQPDVTRKSTGASSSMKKASTSTNIVDDLSSIFGAAPSSSGEFQDIEGETEERRRARLERHQRTQERAAKALADKNQRDLQTQREQAERSRLAETLDFEVKRWAAGKEGNLRALLSTLQYVLWPECGWQPVSLTDLITGAHVKKAYRKATLCIHPDKVQQKGATLQQKYIAEKVFDLLKEAWNKFNSEELF
ncbi:PREDICTED: auxilin-related protein 2-like isoform X1 [Lupinus angustifolius]|uniref:auxilin-related protein 2-like isoform X1 n=1 Tax=Lupinus angustifolius TaxID=3871 RepID=UPI00092F39D3|nr:PREDICTED: auxilin-related protein 2-like isoform X1 [Lupinus angustifolius]